MKIAICGSMNFAKEMIEIKKQLEKKKHIVTLPADAEQYAAGIKSVETKWAKIECDVIRSYFEEIKKADAVLVINRDKNNIKNYVGGNSLIEIAFAHVLHKRIFLLQPVPIMNYSDEIAAMKPIILNGDLTKVR